MSAFIKLGLVVILGLLVLLGVSLLQNAGLLRTQVPQSGGGSELVKDWESIEEPGLATDFVGPKQFCASPSPTSSSELRPSPTDISVECTEEYQPGNAFNEYGLVIDERVIHREPINGLDPGYILTAVCRGNPSPPDCDTGALGCAWMDFEEYLQVSVELTGLYEKVGGLYKLVEGAYTYPFTYSGEPDYTKPRVWTPGVYPSPADPEELLASLDMSLWKLSLDDEQALREGHSKLLETAQRQISEIERHEKVHWEIFERYLPNYVAMINSPWYDTTWGVLRLSSLRDLIEDEFRDGWRAVAVLEDAEHEALHEWENEQIVEVWGDIVPYDGLDHITCSYMQGMVGMFSLLVTGEGYASANYDIHGAGGRVIVTDDYATKEYFTNADIRIEASPKPGYKFKQWKSPVFDMPCTGCAGTTNPVCTIRISTRGDGCRAVFVPISTESPTPTGSPGETPAY